MTRAGWILSSLGFVQNASQSQCPVQNTKIVLYCVLFSFRMGSFGYVLSVLCLHAMLIFYFNLPIFSLSV